MFYIIVMNLVCWNIGGLNDPQKQVVVANMIRDSNISVCGLVETKIVVSKMQEVTKHVWGQWSYVHNAEIDRPS